MKRISTLIVGAAALALTPAALAQETCDFGAPAEGVAEVMAGWDFLIGDHLVDIRLWQEGAWSDPVAQATWNGWWGLGGHALIDEWIAPDRRDGTPGNKGVNVRVWDAEIERWRMT